MRKKSSDHFKDLHELKLMTSFDVSLASSLGRAAKLMFHTLFVTPPGSEVRLTSKVVRSFSSRISLLLCCNTIQFSRVIFKIGPFLKFEVTF